MKKIPAVLKPLLLVLLSSIVLVIAGNLLLGAASSPSQSVKFGVTFSSRYAKYLKLDWQETFRKMLDELGVKNLRLPLYWEDIEPQPGRYNFADADFMLALSKEKGVRVIVVLGIRQPRWPECHLPAWAKQLTVSKRQDQALRFIEQVVQRYQDNPQIWAWQVENEPLLPFGEGCDKPDKGFLKKEVELVKSLSNKPIIMTDSGELGFWVTPMSLSDIFGTTLYRQVYDKSLGYVTYPLPPYFYSLKANLIRNIFARNNSKTIVVELQAEPWLANGIFASAAQQARVLPVEKLKDYVNFAQKTGFDEVYLWGAEWWYFMAANGYPEYLEYAETLF